VPITAGLPFFFASVGHGTAYDIAWRGKADPSNLIATLRLAAATARAAVAQPRG
jgi:4-hydroxy-L-threonine phosphate dehydrogenase PdxA